MTEEDAIDEIDEKLDKTEDYEIIINLLYKKIDLLESVVGKKNKQIQTQQKQIELMAPRIYLNEQEREEMRKYIYTSNKPKDFSSFVKQYFEKQAKEV